jgi:hypothetical protein
MTWPVAAIIGVLLTAAGFWVGYAALAGISKRRRDSTLNPPPIQTVAFLGRTDAANSPDLAAMKLDRQR